MNKWVLPYIDQPLSFWTDLQNSFVNYIEEIYFPLPFEWIGTGRSKQPEKHLYTFLEGSRLPKSILVNPIILPDPLEDIAPRIVEVLHQYNSDFGIDRVTITNLELARYIKEKNQAIRVTGSCLMGMSDSVQLLLAQKFLDSLTPDTRLTHDLEGIRKLRSVYHGQLRLLVNESCIPGCIFRNQHFYEMAYSKSFPLSLCERTLYDMPWVRMLGGWILPQHLHFYDGLYDCLKLAGRVTLQDPLKYVTVLDAYVNRKKLRPHEIGGGPASVLDPIHISDAFFEYILHCDKNCLKCSVCKKYYEENMIS
jgi:hypothetical protein